jgi:tetratricopeptide (TPR) repeat protein
MTRALVLASLVFLTGSWPAVSRGGEITPELGLKINEVLQRAGGQHQKKEYLKAIESYREVLALIPQGASYNRLRLQIHFFIATGFVRLDRADEALDHLEKAVENGFADPSDLERRPDFASLRGLPRYSALLENLRNRAEEERRRFSVA